MSEYSKKIRACMVRSFAQVLKPARKVMDLSITTISEQSGIPEDVLMNIENGRTQLTDTNYIALAAVFDVFMTKKSPADKKILQKILEPDYDDPTIPAHYVEHFKKIEEPFLYKWFATFEELLVRLEKAPKEFFTDEDLKTLAENYKIFIDETVLDNENFALFMARITPFLKNASDVTGSNVYVRITKDVIARIKERAQTSSEDLESLKRATEAIMKYKSEGLLEIFDAENVEAVFDAYREKFQFILITDNRDLAVEINSSQEEQPRISPVLFASVYEDGNIALYDFDSTEQDAAPESSYDDDDDEEESEEWEVIESDDEPIILQENALSDFIRKAKEEYPSSLPLDI
ncbi:MAG: helix-turn-helix transcriptional regulator [Synergistaceae bacterium]|nr:helix-turn-helix transcriptional regulator [Synergistaceae bacterium]